MATASPPKKRRPQAYHERLLEQRLGNDSGRRAEFERYKDELKTIDSIVNQLDALRDAFGLSKAELARMIGKNPASVRRLLTAPANPELRTVVAIATALDAEVQIVPRPQAKRRLKRHAATHPS